MKWHFVVFIIILCHLLFLLVLRCSSLLYYSVFWLRKRTFLAYRYKATIRKRKQKKKRSLLLVFISCVLVKKSVIIFLCRRYIYLNFLPIILVSCFLKVLRKPKLLYCHVAGTQYRNLFIAFRPTNQRRNYPF